MIQRLQSHSRNLHMHNSKLDKKRQNTDSRNRLPDIKQPSISTVKVD